MYPKLLFLLLSTLLLIQSTVLKEVPDSNSSEESNETTPKSTKPPKKPSASAKSSESSEEELSERNKLLVYVLAEFSIFADTTLQSGQQLIKNVIDDVSIVDGEAISQKSAELSAFVEKLEKHTTEKTNSHGFENFVLVVEMSDILEKFKIPTGIKPTTDELIFDLSFKKNGLENLGNEFETNFMKFSENFVREAERYSQNLTAKQKIKERKFRSWLQKYKQEKDMEKMITLFMEFFDLY